MVRLFFFSRAKTKNFTLGIFRNMKQVFFRTTSHFHLDHYPQSGEPSDY
ncbi:hypothetical protein PGN_0494 [Porphyromonas gingivalis ATCC 33277]|uniref:Uncharacterized protein n=1 Tax=Porphyromonas gingivalis (strain ATCC 33277 / DSM 20709 / CIP 103683 / JCM 12257 / NCTC 11834 / 2561) TaxID=431947 RepID=B2RI18_PORG3|nr:hypothetical protein PGN_0494 [Porphyromonas gingivalis ATCC 33277]